jgi:hypothetical protein
VNGNDTLRIGIEFNDSWLKMETSASDEVSHIMYPCLLIPMNYDPLLSRFISLNYPM